MTTRPIFRTDASLDLADNRTPSVARLRSTLGISRKQMGWLVDVSARTIQRWEDSGQFPSNRWVRTVLVDLDHILSLGEEVFTPEGLRIVMTEPQPGFDGKSGLEMIYTGGAKVVYTRFATTHEGGIGV